MKHSFWLKSSWFLNADMDDSYGGLDMSLTDSYKSRDLEPYVILTKFLIFGRFSASWFL